MAHAEGLGLGEGVLDAHGRGVARGHQHRPHPRRAEGVHGEGERERRVDAPREPDDRPGEAVLLHVVPDPRGERPVDALLDRQGLGDRPGPQPHRRAGVDLERMEALHEGGRAQGHRAVGVHGEGGPVEDQLVLPTHEVDVGDGDPVLPGPAHDDLLALGLLPHVVGRGVQVQDEARACGDRLAHRRLRPDVLADRQPHRQPVEVEDAGRGALAEVALLVEDAVVGQALLVVAGGDVPAAQERAGVVDALGRVLGVAEDDVDARHLAGDRGEGPLDPGVEPRAQQQVLGRVAGQGQLGEEDQSGAEPVTRRAGRLDDAPGVAVHVPDQEVDLGQGDAQGGPHRFSTPRGGSPRGRPRSSGPRPSAGRCPPGNGWSGSRLPRARRTWPPPCRSSRR